MFRAFAIAAMCLLSATACVTWKTTPVESRDTPAPPVASGPTIGKGRIRAQGEANDRRFANPSGAEVARILDESGLKYETVDPGRRWMIAFAGEHLARVVLYVIHGREFTIVLGKLFTIGESTGPAFYRTIARKNYELDQLKLSVDTDGGVYASFEVPTRIVDKRELLENIFGLASAIDKVMPELIELAEPITPPDDATEEPVTPEQKKQRTIPPPGPGENPIIEARRQVRPL